MGRCFFCFRSFLLVFRRPPAEGPSKFGRSDAGGRGSRYFGECFRLAPSCRLFPDSSPFVLSSEGYSHPRKVKRKSIDSERQAQAGKVLAFGAAAKEGRARRRRRRRGRRRRNEREKLPERSLLSLSPLPNRELSYSRFDLARGRILQGLHPSRGALVEIGAIGASFRSASNQWKMHQTKTTTAATTEVQRRCRRREAPKTHSLSLSVPFLNT